MRGLFQGLLVGLQGGFQFTGAGEGVSSVVMGAGAVALGECGGRFFIISGAIMGTAAPFRVFEGLRRALRLALSTQTFAALVRVAPQCSQPRSVTGLRRSGHGGDENQRQQYAGTKRINNDR